MTPSAYLQESLDKTKHIARYNVTESNDELIPVLITLDAKGEYGAVYGLGVDDLALPDAIRRVLVEEEPDSYIFVVECWVTQFKDAAAAVEGRVSDMPLDDRREVVQIIGVEKGNPETLTYLASIKNNGDGSRSLGDWERADTEWGPSLAGEDSFLTLDW